MKEGASDGLYDEEGKFRQGLVEYLALSSRSALVMGLMAGMTCITHARIPRYVFFFFLFLCGFGPVYSAEASPPPPRPRVFMIFYFMDILLFRQLVYWCARLT